MSATATIDLQLDQHDSKPINDPFPDTDVIEDVGYAVGTTSAYLKHAATCAIYEQSIGWAKQVAAARSGLFRQPHGEVPGAFFTSREWNTVTFDVERGPFVWQKEPKRVDLAIALAPNVDVNDQWSTAVFESVVMLSQLDFNWNGLGGEPLRNDEAVRGLRLLASLREEISDEPFIYPSPEGGTVIEIGVGRTKVTVLLERDLALVGGIESTPQSFDISTSDDWERFVCQTRSMLASVRSQSN